jgi:3D (Asp-Asp-Asp) domain-containing protein
LNSSAAGQGDIAFLYEEVLMSKEIHHAIRKPKRFLRIAAVIIGFGCIVHIAQIKCAKSMGNYSLFLDNQRSASNGLEEFQATAYCDIGITKSGIMVAPGHVAADPRVIPLGSMIYIESPLMGGIYQVLDTGRLVKGKIVDIFIPSYERCVDFGRRMVKVKVLRYGFLGYPPDQQPEK